MEPEPVEPGAVPNVYVVAHAPVSLSDQTGLPSQVYGTFNLETTANIK